jgi:hypothetical protein
MRPAASAARDIGASLFREGAQIKSATGGFDPAQTDVGFSQRRGAVPTESRSA